MMARDNIRCMSRIMNGVLAEELPRTITVMHKTMPTIMAVNLHPSKDTCTIRQALRKLRTILVHNLEECKQTSTIKKKQAVGSIEILPGKEVMTTGALRHTGCASPKTVKTLTIFQFQQLWKVVLRPLRSYLPRKWRLNKL